VTIELYIIKVGGLCSHSVVIVEFLFFDNYWDIYC